MLAALPMIMIVISLVFIAVPMSFDAQTLNEVLPITIGSVVFIGVGEMLAAKKGKDSGPAGLPWKRRRSCKKT